MNLDKWIALGGLIASFFSAIAAFLAIRQTIIQRLISVKPQLIIKETKLITDKIKSFGTTLNIMGDLKNTFQVDVLNIGLGVAMKIKYQWVFDYTLTLNELDITLLDVPPTISRKDIFGYINSQKYYYEVSQTKEYQYVCIIGKGVQKYFTHKTEPYELEYI